jgi:putative sigma-54 modulation protein
VYKEETLFYPRIKHFLGGLKMKVKISFKHLQHTPALDERIREKSKKLEKYLGGKCLVKWTCYVKNQNHHADIELIGPTFEYHSSSWSDNLYKSLDKAIHKLEIQLSKKKEKMKNRIHQSKTKPVILDPENAWTDYDEDNYQVREEWDRVS